MFVTLATIALMALTRAEIIERFKAPVITQADGLVQVFANCPEDMRREYQSPIARFVTDTVQALYGGVRKRPIRFRKPGIVIHVGDVRTNLTEVVARVATNDSRVVSRIYVKSPGSADLERLRTEVIKAFYRCVEGAELSDAEAVLAYRHAVPALRIADERRQLELWLQGKGEIKDDEEGLRLMRKVIAPGQASRRDVLIFASRLYLYPPWNDMRFAGRFDCLSFREALACAKVDPFVRIVAAVKSKELPVFGGGRSEELAAAAVAYRAYLLALARGEANEDVLTKLLDDADEKLNVAFELAQ